MKIMTVDDSLVMRSMITNIAHALGVEVVHAENGQHAIEMYEQNPDVELILLDWNMPVMNGFEFLTYLRANLEDETPVIMVTTESEKEKIISAIQAGANHYLIKPFAPEELSMRIKQVVH